MKLSNFELLLLEKEAKGTPPSRLLFRKKQQKAGGQSLLSNGSWDNSSHGNLSKKFSKFRCRINLNSILLF